MVKGSGNGWFRTKKGKKLYCWYNDAGDERSKVIGEASMTDADGWLEVAKLNLNQQVGKPDPKNATFGEVMNHWLEYGKTKTGEDKDDSTRVTDARNARNYLSHWADHVAKDMQPLEIQQWLDKQSKGLRSKLKNTMSAIFMHGLKFGFIPRGESGEIDKYNPMKLVSAPCKSDFESVELSGAEAAGVIRSISDPLVKVLVILVAVTGMRISEALALTWDAIDWTKGKIRIRRKWNGKSYGKPKSRMSRKPVEMTKGAGDRAGGLAAGNHVCAARGFAISIVPEARGAASARQHDRGGLCSSSGNRCGVLEQRNGGCYYDGELVERFGFHSVLHGLGTWLDEQGTDPMVIQRMLRHGSKDMTMHYIHAKARKAQEQYIAELGIVDDSQPTDNGCSLRVQ